MQQYCHRCGGELPPENEIPAFCPHCGAPQLFLQEQETVNSAIASDVPGVSQSALAQQVDWKSAIRCAAFVAVIAALLSLLGFGFPKTSILGTFWILSASITTLALYQHRLPLARMDASIGARIGMMTGLAMAVCIAITLAISGLVSRFVLHVSGSFDVQMNEAIQEATTQLSHSAAGKPGLSDALHFMATPEFRAGYGLFCVAFLSLVLLFISTLGGAFGGLLRSRRRAGP